MRRQILMTNLVIAAAVLVGILQTSPVRAGGYYNLPGNFCQCVGHGFGAGYHAPLVLGPPSCRDCCRCHEVRLPYSPSAFGCAYSCGCGGPFGVPSSMQGYVSTAPVPAPAPSPAVATPAAEPVVPAELPPVDEAATAAEVPATPSSAASEAYESAPVAGEATIAPSADDAVIYAPSSVAEPTSEPPRRLFDPPVQP